MHAPLSICHRRTHQGFTLIELLITLAVSVILIMVAVPSFKYAILSNRLTTGANELAGAIQNARMQAIKTNSPAQLCSDSASLNADDTVGNACGTQAGAVFALLGGTAKRVSPALPTATATILWKGNVVPLHFSGVGLASQVNTTGPYSGLVADLCTPSMTTNNHRQITMTTGSVVTITTTDGPCP